MKISIAMCTYNGALYVQEQLKSIAAQTRVPDELVICDDRSSDNTLEIVESFAANAAFPVRIYINNENLGSTKNFEKAIELCDGELIAPSDQDDVWHPEKLLRSEAALSSQRGVGMVFTDADVVDENMRPMNLRLWECVSFRNKEQKLFTAGKAFNVLFARNVVTGTTMTFRAEFKPLILPVPTDFSVIHDGWIALMISAVADIAFIPERSVKYRQHSGQQVGAFRPAAKAGTPSTAMPQLTQVDYLAEANRVKMMYERLSAYAGNHLRRDVEAQLHAKMTHFNVRARMPDRKYRRLPFVLRELSAFRYHLYSNGMYSAARDLLG